MQYTVCFDEDTGCLSVRVSGRVDGPSVRAMAEQARHEAEVHHCTRFLDDCREMETRHAVVVRSLTPDVRFYENVSVNRGQIVRVFTDIDEARAWLTR
jgi:hypothetical protein